MTKNYPIGGLCDDIVSRGATLTHHMLVPCTQCDHIAANKTTLAIHIGIHHYGIRQQYRDTQGLLAQIIAESYYFDN